MNQPAATSSADDPWGPFGPPPTGWRAAPDCGRCNDTGRFTEGGCCGGTVNAHCSCKTGRRMSELWYAEKHGEYHPDMPEPEPPYDDEPYDDEPCAEEAEHA